jgi:hypothetical protein
LSGKSGYARENESSEHMGSSTLTGRRDRTFDSEIPAGVEARCDQCNRIATEGNRPQLERALLPLEAEAFYAPKAPGIRPEMSLRSRSQPEQR